MSPPINDFANNDKYAPTVTSCPINGGQSGKNSECEIAVLIPEVEADNVLWWFDEYDE